VASERPERFFFKGRSEHLAGAGELRLPIEKRVGLCVSTASGDIGGGGGLSLSSKAVLHKQGRNQHAIGEKGNIQNKRMSCLLSSDGWISKVKGYQKKIRRKRLCFAP